ncbi:hypothetical protein CFC21_021427 [Triticum aestivum]|uniref:DUF4220 domain-containing protein n=2 Tax=Triticum aestivum TaxID=4565 RepID=A0A9R1E9K6_WHEAT|nr:hypothetical protein CFC21_021427 [Triticum aestivum]
MAAGLDPLVALWKEWGIQVLVLLSLALQVILLVTAEIRRRKDSGVLRVVVWSAYLMADMTAIYTLGHMLVTSRLPEHELVAFWAPFLLLHLGGQDNITAYSIEDNRLWLRHLQSFVVQVLAAIYVLYESSIFTGGRQSMLGQATILMFVVGVVKYGERVWALKSASSSALSGKNYNSFGRLHFVNPYTTRSWSPAPFLAHDLLSVPKHLLKGPLPLVAFDMKACCSWEDMYNIAENQLSLMYDVFYSKAELIHTWYGHCIRLTSLAATATALRLLFLGLSDKDGYNRVDVAATYVLLAGAVVLEITSLLRAMCSSWSLQQMITLARGHTVVSRRLVYLFYPAFLCGHLVRFALPRLGIQIRCWSGTMGQHNWIYMCSHCKDSRSSKIARWMGREDWWNTLVYTSSSVSVSADFRLLLKEQLRGSVGVDEENAEHIQNSRGRAALKKKGLYDDELLAWSVDTELDQSILVWHIATHVYLSWYKAEHGCLPHHAKVTEELSNYMMFLLAARPYMLPDNASRQKYIELCNKVINDLKLKYSSAEDLIMLVRNHGDALGAGRAQPSGNADTIEENADIIIENETFDRASQLSTKLITMETPDTGMLKLINQVWVEMLSYAGYRCRPDSHARQLSNGGEITTIVVLLVEYLKSDFLEFEKVEQDAELGMP